MSTCECKEKNLTKKRCCKKEFYEKYFILFTFCEFFRGIYFRVIIVSENNWANNSHHVYVKIYSNFLYTHMMRRVSRVAVFSFLLRGEFICSVKNFDRRRVESSAARVLSGNANLYHKHKNASHNVFEFFGKILMGFPSGWCVRVSDLCTESKKWRKNLWKIGKWHM